MQLGLIGLNNLDIACIKTELSAMRMLSKASRIRDRLLLLICESQTLTATAHLDVEQNISVSRVGK